MAKLKILEVIGDSSLAGAPRHFIDVVENLDLDKFEVAAICPPGPLAGELKKLHRKIDLEVIRMDSRLDMSAIGKIRRHIKSTKPDIIHIHGTRAGVLGRLAAINLGIPVIYTEHLWTKNFKLDSRILTFFHYFSNWVLDMFTNLNIAVSGAVKDFLVTSHISYPEKVVVVYNGIEEVKEKAEVLKDPKKIKIATVGTLNAQKGMQYLIKALPLVLKEFPETSLEIIGSGPYQRNLKKIVEKLKLGKFVKFAGFLPDVSAHLAKFDLYVQPSLSESFGLAIVQAMSVGLPVVATATGGIPEVVTQGKSGILVPTEDSKALSAAILEMIRDPKMARKMGEIGRRDARLKFNLDDMITELEQIYVEMATQPSFAEQPR